MILPIEWASLCLHKKAPPCLTTILKKQFIWSSRSAQGGSFQSVVTARESSIWHHGKSIHLIAEQKKQKPFSIHVSISSRESYASETNCLENLPEATVQYDLDSMICSEEVGYIMQQFDKFMRTQSQYKQTTLLCTPLG